MVDTIAFRLDTESMGAAAKALREHLLGRGEVETPRGVRLRLGKHGNFKAEAELPKLKWQHNGRLITSQDELDACLQLFDSELFNMLQVHPVKFLFRIDLCWQFEARARDLILGHQWIHLPGIRKAPSLMYGDKEIVWRGGKSRFAVKMYDKRLAMGAGKGVLRVEVTLAGQQLRTRINVAEPLKLLDLWRVYRSVLVQLQPTALPEPRRHSYADLFAMLAPKEQSRLLSAYSQGRSDRAVRAFKANVSAANVKPVGWRWSDQLPENEPPVAIHVELRRGTSKEP